MVNNILNMTSRDTDYVMFTGEWLKKVDCNFADTILMISCTFAPYILELTSSGDWHISGAGYYYDFSAYDGDIAIRDFFELCEPTRLTINNLVLFGRHHKADIQKMCETKIKVVTNIKTGYNKYEPVVTVKIPVFIKTGINDETGELVYRLYVDGNAIEYEYNDRRLAIDTMRLIADLYGTIITDTIEY